MVREKHWVAMRGSWCSHAAIDGDGVYAEGDGMSLPFGGGIGVGGVGVALTTVLEVLVGEADPGSRHGAGVW